MGIYEWGITLLIYDIIIFVFGSIYLFISIKKTLSDKHKVGVGDGVFGPIFSFILFLYM